MSSGRDKNSPTHKPNVPYFAFPLQKKRWFLPLYESFMRGEEEDEEEEDVEDEEEERVMVGEEAWAAARPSRNKELQVTIMAAIIIIMVIILAHLEQTVSFQKLKSGKGLSAGLWPSFHLMLNMCLIIFC